MAASARDVPRSKPGTSQRPHYPDVHSCDTDSSSSQHPSMTPSSDTDSGDEDSDLALTEDVGEQSYELRSLSSSWLDGQPRRSHSPPVRGETADSDEEYAEDEEGKYFLPGPERRLSDSTVQSFQLYTPDEDRAVVGKLDRHLVAFLALLYMLSFLDRSNIGNARIAGLVQDLPLTSTQYEWLLTAFYITYLLFEWMTLMYRVIPPHIYVSVCVCSWGLLASLQSVVSSFGSLLVLRALLGISEAAFGPGVPFYLSFFFRRNELAFRTGLFISAAPLATSFASSLAWLITKLGQDGPIAPWRLLFLVEGFPSVVVAIFAWNLIPDGPGFAKFLTRRQRKVAVLRLRNERLENERANSDQKFGEKEADYHGRLKRKEILEAFLDPKCYLTALMFFSCNVAFSSMPVFLPTIINEMGYTSLTSQALAAPPYLFSFIIVLLTAHLSDHLNSRSIPLVIHSVLASGGYSLIALAGFLRWPNLVRYLAIYPACAGFFSAITIIITWTLNNQDSDSKKGTGMAILNIIGQCGPLLGTKLYPDTDRPYYVRGMAICAACMFAVGALAFLLRTTLVRENERTEREVDWEDGEPKERFVFIL